MIKKILFILLVFLSPLSASSSHSLYCSDELQEVVLTAQKLPEVNTLFEKVLQEGPLNVELNRHISQQFEGYWSEENRTIYLTKTRDSTKGTLIGTLIFELHNAYRAKELHALTDKAASGKITRTDFIRAFEFVEFKNAKDTQKMIAKGVKGGIYPFCSNVCYSDDFEDHYALQQDTGHSDWIGHMYDGYYCHD